MGVVNVTADENEKENDKQVEQNEKKSMMDGWSSSSAHH
jgi:hypothetical protein